MGYNKYHAIKTGKSASRKEENRKRELEMLEMAGEISNLRCQVKYELIPQQRETKRPHKCIERNCCYVADFVYTDKHGETVVEDVKGYKGGEAYKVFVIKRKLMLWRYGIRIREV